MGKLPSNTRKCAQCAMAEALLEIAGQTINQKDLGRSGRMTRTDNDTWDLASSVGATATMIATARALASRAENPLINDPFAEPLVRAVGIDLFTRLASGELRLEDIGDHATGGRWMIDNIAIRTKFYDDFFGDAATAGIRQVVILAAFRLGLFASHWIPVNLFPHQPIPPYGRRLGREIRSGRSDRKSRRRPAIAEPGQPAHQAHRRRYCATWRPPATPGPADCPASA